MDNPFQSKPLTEGQIKWAVKQTKSMTQASKVLNVSYTTFKKYSSMYGLFKPNQEGKGIPKRRSMKKGTDINFDLDSWINTTREMGL